MLADREWQQAERRPAAAPALSQHFKALLDNGASLRPLPLDGTLVTQARASGRLLPRAKILYDGIKRTYAADSSQGLRVDQLAGLDVERVFKRRSGIPLSTPLPRLYTPGRLQADHAGGPRGARARSSPRMHGSGARARPAPSRMRARSSRQ